MFNRELTGYSLAAPSSTFRSSYCRLRHGFGVTRHELALGYVKARLPRARVLVGVETPSQLNDDLASWEKPAAPGLVAAVEECFGQVDEKVLNPSLWGRV